MFFDSVPMHLDVLVLAQSR